MHYRSYILILLLSLFSGCGSENNTNVDTLVDNHAYDPSSYALKKTGQQTTVYTYDDGFYKKGKAPAYSRQNEIVTDNVTGLMWQDNSDVISIQKSWLTQEKYDTAAYGDTSGDTASSYCKNLTLGNYTDWRLPSKRELESIIDYANYSPALDTTVFSYFSNENYWTSYTDTQSTLSVYVRFREGTTGNSNKLTNNYIRCTRSTEIPRPHLAHSYGTVKDSVNEREWQDDYSDNSGVIKNTTWENAINYCENLTLDSKEDWRLPNINELKSIVDLRQSFPSIDKTAFLKTEATNYASSTSYISNPNNIAWFVTFNNNGRTYLWDFNKDSNVNVRCIRDIPLSEKEAAMKLTKGAELFQTCISCHGRNGERSALGRSAIIGGQDIDYLITELKGYRNGTINKTGLGEVMTLQVGDFSDADIEAVAIYISTLL